MSKDIENKVVSIEFDNSKFEKPAKESINTLDKLKEALSFDGVSKGFEKLAASIKTVTFSPIEKSIDSVYAKFTFFERFTIQLYDRLANKIINFGETIARETFKTPISSGKSEYEEKMGAIQTIMASTGEDLKTVNAYLDELNKYSDDTIYSFSDMTNSIGKFTNAGVKLKDAVVAIKGISNEAARSGANANEASRAMYNFAQALATGSVKLIDWKSIENANMATVEFKQQLIDMAVKMKTLTKTTNGYTTAEGKALTATMGFNDSLQDAWLTSDVLIETLKLYGTETTDIGRESQKAATEVKTFSMMVDTLKESLQSGWAESWQLIIGDFEKAVDLWTQVTSVLGGVIDKINSARNAMLKYWNQMGGRKALMTAFSNAWHNIMDVMHAVRDAFRTVFPPMTGEKLVSLTKKFEDFTRKLKPSDQTLKNIRNTFKGLFSVIGIVIDGAKALYGALSPLFGKAFKFLTKEVLGATGGLGNWLYNLRKTIQEGKVFEKVFSKVAVALSYLGKAFSKAFYFLKDVILAFKNGGIKEGLSYIRDRFAELMKNIWEFIKEYNPITLIAKLGVKIGETISEWPVGEAIVKMAKKIKDAIANSPVWKFCVNVVEGFVDLIQKAINKLRGIDTSAADEMTSNVKKSFGPLEALKNFFSAIWHGIVAVWEWAAPTLKSLGGQVKELFVGLFSGIKGIIDRSDMGDVGLFAAGGGLGAMLLSITAFIHDLRKLSSGSGKITKGFGKILYSVADAIKAFKMEIYAKSIKDIAVSMILLAGALFLLSALPADAITRATAAIILLFKGLTSSMDSFSSIKAPGGAEGGKGIAGAFLSMGAQIMAIAVAMGILVANMVILALLPYEKLIKGVAVVILLLRAISSETIKMSSQGGNAKTIGTLVGIAAILMAMILPITILSIIAAFNAKGLIIAAATIAVFMLAIAGIARILQSSTNKYGAQTPKLSGTFIAMTLAIIGVMSAISFLAIIFSMLSLANKEKAIEQAVNAIKDILKMLMILVLAIAGINGLMSFIHQKWGGTVESITRVKKGNKTKQVSRSSNAQGSFKSLGAFGTIAGAIIGIAVGVMVITGAMAILAAVSAPLDDKHWERISTLVIIMTGALGAIMALVTLISMFGGGGKNKLSAGNLKVSDVKANISLFPPIVSFVIAASVAILAIAGAAKLMSSVDIEYVISAGVVVLGIIGLLGLLMKVADKYPKGVKRISQAFTIFAKASLLFSIGVATMIAALSLLAKVTGSQVDNFVDNIVSVTDKLVARQHDIIYNISRIVEIMIYALITGISKAAVTLTTETFKMAMTVLDTLIEQAPELIAKALILIGKVLDGITDKAEMITEKLVTALIAVIDGLAKAIDKHRKELLDAINRAFEAIIALILGLFGKLFSITDESMEKIKDTIMPYAKVISASLIGIFAYKKIKSGAKEVIDTAKDVISIADRIKTKIKESAVQVKTVIDETGKLKTVTENVGTLKTYLSGFPRSLKGIFSSITDFVKGHPVLTAIALAYASGKLLAKIIDKVSEKIKVVSHYDSVVTDDLNKQRKVLEELNATSEERKKSFNSIEEEYRHNERVLDVLRECVDENGKVKAGYETRFAAIRKQVESGGIFSVEVDAESNIVRLLDEQNNLLDIQDEKVTDIMKKRQLMAKVEAAEESVKDIRSKMESGYYAEKEAEALKRYNEVANEIYRNEEGKSWGSRTTKQMAVLNDEYTKLKNLYVSKDGYATKEWYAASDAQKDWFNELRLHAKDINDAKAALLSEDYAVSLAKSNTTMAKAKLQNVEDLFKSLDGTTEDIEKALAKIDYDVVLTDVGNSITGVISQFETYSKEIGGILASGAEVTPELKKKYENLFSVLAESLGDSEEGREYLYNVGYTDAGSFVNGLSKRFTEEAEGNAIEGLVGSMAGLIKGGANNVGAIKSFERFMKGLADSGLQAYKDEVDQHSPSKKWMEVGAYDVMGLIKGADSKEGLLGKTYSSIATSTMAAYTAAAAKETSKYQFSPMFNTSGIQNGTSYIKGQLSSLQNGQIDTSLTSKLAASIDPTKLEAGNEKVVSAIEELRADIDEMTQVLSNLQVVMDTGATVGALAPAMDKELGRRLTRKTRGVN